jgi:hypothetical protein
MSKVGLATKLSYDEEGIKEPAYVYPNFDEALVSTQQAANEPQIGMENVGDGHSHAVKTMGS